MMSNNIAATTSDMNMRSKSHGNSSRDHKKSRFIREPFTKTGERMIRAYSPSEKGGATAVKGSSCSLPRSGLATEKPYAKNVTPPGRYNLFAFYGSRQAGGSNPHFTAIANLDNESKNPIDILNHSKLLPINNTINFIKISILHRCPCYRQES